jgi:hypothetical protein
MKNVLVAVIALVLTVDAAAQCAFRYAPVDDKQFYRSEGWALPGISDFNPRAEPRLSGLPDVADIPGATAEVLPHDAEPYIVEFPAQAFTIDGARQRMQKVLAKAGVVRWQFNRKVVAYSYGLVPVDAHKHNGKWVVTAVAGCIFTATFIDDRGDGVFRVLVPRKLTPELIPEWAKLSNRPQ